MNKTLIIFLFIISTKTFVGQATRVAILDFDNISGIAKYDGLGKAMSSMLISDIESNVSPKRLQLVERAQIKKILKEQNFQSSGSVNKNTAVKVGKILGVSYLLVGDVYILNDQLIINARLTNTETGDIVFSKKQEGKIIGWLTLKTNIAKDLASNLSQPFTKPTIPDKETNFATISTFANAVSAKDTGDIKKAEELINTVQEFNPDFKYLDDLKSQLDVLKKQVEKNTADIKNLNEEVIENITDYLELGFKYSTEKNFTNAEKYFLIGLSKVDKGNIVNYLEYNYALSQLYYKNGNYVESLKYSEMGLSVYPYFKEFIYFKYNSLGKLNRLAEFDQIIKTANDIRKLSSDSLIIAYLKKFSEKHKVNYYDIEKYIQWKQHPSITLIKAIKHSGAEFYFNENFAIPFNSIAIGCIQEVYNEKPEQAASLLKQLDLSNSSSEIKYSVAWYTMLSGDFSNAQKLWDDIVIRSFWRTTTCADYGKNMMVKAGVNMKSVQNIRYVYDLKRGVVYQDSIREYFPDGTIRSFYINEVERDTIKLNKPFWYYEYDDGRGFVTLNPIEAYIFKANLQYPIDAIIDCIKSSGSINWPSVSESEKMALINWGHSYMLYGEINKAVEIYKLFPYNFEFGKEYNHLMYKQVLLSDWNEFKKLGFISSNQIINLTNKLF
jgi:TolB-like protein